MWHSLTHRPRPVKLIRQRPPLPRPVRSVGLARVGQLAHALDPGVAGPAGGDGRGHRGIVARLRYFQKFLKSSLTRPRFSCRVSM